MSLTQFPRYAMKKSIPLTLIDKIRKTTIDRPVLILPHDIPDSNVIGVEHRHLVENKVNKLI